MKYKAGQVWVANDGSGKIVIIATRKGEFKWRWIGEAPIHEWTDYDLMRHWHLDEVSEVKLIMSQYE